ncbi:DUF4279 domain-containing protein [Mucilaginibacter paludis]|uniref:DUF4279 domain-containing protein n=1 Tax=Mucilaginibacter paludis DSM 18603 TaxID=714943 RepID=H1YEM8_9SPHI|nr:DUF4279 domain-containing protein [Mucilaginibacter paludis]EHQ30788.1 hypothetical protein Mucpa_6739 [Mucilaginibacter paludis DSM 18603]
MYKKENELNRNDEYGCSLLIETDEDHPAIITNLLQVEPSELIVKGSQKYNKNTGEVIAGKFNNRNLWILNVEKQVGSDEVHLNKPIEIMLDLLDKHQSSFLEVLDKYPKNHLLCYAYFYDYNPYFVLSKQLICRLSKYSIGIEFDTYYLVE